MKKNFKRTLAYLMAVIMLIGVMPVVNVFAAEIVSSGTCGENLTWTLDDGGTLTISGEGEMTDYGWNGSPWYSGRTSIKNVVIEDGVTSIGDCAFRGCTGLTSVTIGNSVTSIGNYAFEDCTGLTSVTIPNSVTSIGGCAFYGCTGLTSVMIGNSVTSIGWGVFRDCTALTSITVDANNPNYSSENGVLFNKDKTELVRYPIGDSRTEYTIPDGVTSIGECAFEGCTGLTSVTIPDGVTSIGDDAFDYCTGLKSVTVPDSITNIGSGAFSGTAYYNDDSNWKDNVLYIGNCLIKCKDDITGNYNIEENTKMIADFAFSDCTALTSITVDENNTKYSSQDGVLFNKNKTELLQYPCGNERREYFIPDSVIKLGSFSFYCNETLENLIIGKNVEIIGCGALIGMWGLTELVIPDSVIEIEDGAFGGSVYLTDIIIGKGVKSIGSYAFCDCESVTDLTIPDNVLYIGDGAFNGMGAIVNITIGKGVTSLGYKMFSYCDYLEKVVIPKNVIEISDDAFLGSDSAVIYGEENSYAESFAREKNIPFVAITFEHEHDYKDTVTKAPTCTEKGIMTYSCSCGESYTEIIAATGNHIDSNNDGECDTCGKNLGTKPSENKSFIEKIKDFFQKIMDWFKNIFK